MSVASAPQEPAKPAGEQDRNFRFFDNRQKYLLFVNTTSEKLVVANRVASELAHLKPKPPALRLFDAGVGDGSVLTRVMRAAHHRFPNVPFYVVAKEISLEDMRLTLAKLADRFCEHPATVVVLTNLNYADAPWLTPKAPDAAARVMWKEVRLTGRDSHDFETQIAGLEPFLTEAWAAGVSPKTGNPTYKHPSVLVIHRDDQTFALDAVIPRQGQVRADYDLVIASQPYRARASLDFKVKKVIAPLARALGPGGRLIAIQSHGGDPAQEIVQAVWPGDNPFLHDRHMILKGLEQELGGAGLGLRFEDQPDSQALFKYAMHTLPSEVEGSIGTSTAFAAWNAAVYVSQVEDQRLAQAVSDSRYLDATSAVLRKHGGLWFWDEAYIVTRQG